MRVFLAIDLPPPVKKEIAGLLKDLKRKHWSVKWVKLKNLHITIIFLGNVDKNSLQLIKEDRRAITKKIKPFRLNFKGLGCFPSYDWPRIIWLGLKGDLKSLAKLQKGVAGQLKEQGLKLGRQRFSPHITLGRVKKARAGERREIGRQLKGLRNLDFKSQLLVDQLIVYQSQSLASGPVYTRLAELSLAGGSS